MKKQRLWIGFLLILAFWYSGHLFVDGRLIPSPVGTLGELISLLISGELLVHLFFSLYRLIAAVGLAIILGSATGIFMGMNKRGESILAPFVYVMFPVPKAALLPVLFLLFGLGDMTKVILIALILYFQITFSVYDGVKQIPSAIFLSAGTLRLRGYDLYKHVIFPAVLPHIFSSLRVSVGIGIAVLFFAETYATKYGLGYFIMNHWALLEYEKMYGAILVLGGLGYVIFRVIDLISERLVHWR